MFFEFIKFSVDLDLALESACLVQTCIVNSTSLLQLHLLPRQVALGLLVKCLDLL